MKIKLYALILVTIRCSGFVHFEKYDFAFVLNLGCVLWLKKKKIAQMVGLE